MHARSLADPDVRASLYQRLVWRNRVIDGLRVLVPLVGAALLGFLMVQIYFGNLAREFGVTGIRLERDRLIIDTPHYEGMTEAGAHYKVVAVTASALVSQADVIELGDVTLELDRPDGVSFTATADRALYDIIRQTVEVPGGADVIDSRRTRSLLQNTFVDWSDQTITARDGADVTFADGTRLLADTLLMYGDTGKWDMTGVTLVTEQGDAE